MRPLRRILPAALLLVLAAPRSARAQGFAANRFEPSDRGSDWFTAESLDLRGHLRPAAGLVVDYAHRPLAIYEQDGSLRTAIVGHQLTGHVGGTLVMWDRLRLALDLPVVLSQSGETGTLGGVALPGPANSAAAGDLRVGGDVRLLGQYGDPLTVAIGVRLFAPTGSRSSYTSDGSVRVLSQALAAGEVGAFAYAGRLGVEARPPRDVGGAELGTRLVFGGAAGVHMLDKKLLVGPEVSGSTGLNGSDALFGRRTTPLEVLLGGHYRFASEWRAGAGGGVGLTRGDGTPDFRLLASVEWMQAIPPPAPPPPPPPPPDRDHDLVVDAEDACPDDPGVRTSDPKTNGCPPPPPDRDGDAVVDADDACPDVPGVRTTDPKTNGCPPPPPDRDKDGIPDDKDACPDEPGPPNPDPTKNGCPKAFVSQNQIKITDRVKFQTNKADILPGKDSEDVLLAVLHVLNEHPEIKKVSVEGHTDSSGEYQLNRRLGDERAASVVKWLTSHGVAKDRLVSVGHGPTRPIDTNDTPEGRQNNRRVEFIILEPSKEESK